MSNPKINPTRNLESDYDQVVTYLENYRQFVSKVNSRVMPIIVKDPMEYWKNFPRLWRQLNPLSGKNSELYREWGSKYATDEEKRHDYYPIMTSEYPLHDLSLSLEKQFGTQNIPKLKKLHELKKHQISRFSVSQIVGFVLAAATVLLKSIPESVVKRVFDYAKFELVVFATAWIAIVYLVLIMLPLWLKYNKAKRVHDYAGDVIEYTAIRTGKENGNKQ